MEEKDGKVNYEYLIWKIYKEFGLYPMKIVRKTENGDYISEFVFFDFFRMNYVRDYVSVKICPYYYFGFYSCTFGLECHLFDVVNKSLFESNVIVDQNNVRDLLMSMSSISISGLEAICNGEYSNKVFVGPECSEYINLFDNNLVSLNGKVDSDRLKLFCDSLLSEESKGISEDFGLKKTLGNVRK